jgi:hypothetical protein
MNKAEHCIAEEQASANALELAGVAESLLSAGNLIPGHTWQCTQKEQLWLEGISLTYSPVLSDIRHATAHGLAEILERAV